MNENKLEKSIASNFKIWFLDIERYLFRGRMLRPFDKGYIEALDENHARKILSRLIGDLPATLEHLQVTLTNLSRKELNGCRWYENLISQKEFRNTLFIPAIKIPYEERYIWFLLEHRTTPGVYFDLGEEPGYYRPGAMR